MRIELKGLHWTPAKLADGTKRDYWYAWRGGPRLKGSLAHPNSSPASTPRSQPASLRRKAGSSR